MNTQENTALVAAQPTILDVIARAASDPTVDVHKMKELLAIQQEVHRTNAEIAFNEAMNACQKELPRVFKAAQNASNKSKFAKLEKVDEAIRPVYTKHGFSLSFGSRAIEGGVTVTCRVSHTAGHHIDHELSGALDTKGAQGTANKTDIQGLGSSVSYLRRYLTCMIFNVILTDEDNDGQKSAYITDVQKQAIINALGGPGERVAKFCEKYALTSLDELAAESFDKAMAQIRKANEMR